MIIEHGTRAGYLHRCKCEACLEAGRLYQREYDRKRHEQSPRVNGEPAATLTHAWPRLTHGNRSTYNRGCPCDDCREANRIYAAEREA